MPDTAEDNITDLAIIRGLSSALVARSTWMAAAGKTFHGKRDVFRVLGYKEVLLPEDYRFRYTRNGVAKRIVDTFPDATWRGGAEVLENDDREKVTPFEQGAADLIKKFKLWNVFSRLDKASGLGHYSVLLLGLPGNLEDPVIELDKKGQPKVSGSKISMDDILYFSVYTEEDAIISQFDTDWESPRFGLPTLYNLRRTSVNPNQRAAFTVNKVVHWSRVIHVADDVLDDPVNGHPRLEASWNLLDDLEKVTGGGAEAFWKRADQGLQINISKDVVKFEPESEKALERQIEEYIHGLRRVIQTRGVDVNPLGSDVADFNSPAQGIFDQLAAATGIPQRILMGSERGELASSSDQSNFDDRVQDRRSQQAHPNIVQPFFERMIVLGVVPEPKEFFTEWPEIKNLNESQRADVVLKWSQINAAQKSAGSTPVVTPNEMREKGLGFTAFTPQEQADQQAQLEQENTRRTEQNVTDAKTKADIAVRTQHGLPQAASDEQVTQAAQTMQDAIAAKGAAAAVKLQKFGPKGKQAKAAQLHAAVSKAMDDAHSTLQSPALRLAMHAGNTDEVRRILKSSLGSIREELEAKIPETL